MQRLWAWARGFHVELALFGGMFIVLWLLAILFRQDATHLSYAAHFVAQDQSWLHGHLDVPAWLGHDLVHIGDKLYIVYPPAPALLMLPFVAVLGDHFSDIWFSWLAGAANVALLFHLLQAIRRKGWSQRPTAENVIIALTFGLGSIALWLAVGGTVWFTAQTLAITFTLLMLLATVRHNWWLASAALGALFLTRSPDILGGIVVLAVAWQSAVKQPQPESPQATQAPLHRNGEGLGWGQLVLPPPRTILALAIPMAVTLVIWLVRNKLYFGSWLSSGYDLQIAQDYPQIQYGLLSWHYIWPNFVVDFLNLPAFNFASPYDVHPVLDVLRGGNGTSIFFTTPLFLLFFLPAQSAAPRWLRAALWLCVGLLIAFSLVWNLTGWYQVGARYLFDVYPYLFLLLAMRGERIGWRWLTLAGAGMMVNLALANVFWCQDGACLGDHLTTRWLAFGMLLAAVPLACGAAWWWLRREPVISREVEDATTSE